MQVFNLISLFTNHGFKGTESTQKKNHPPTSPAAFSGTTAVLLEYFSVSTPADHCEIIHVKLIHFSIIP